MSKEDKLTQIKQVKKWGVDHGLLHLQKMYATEVDAKYFWAVTLTNPNYPSETIYDYFGTDEESARQYAADADTLGWIYYISSFISANEENIPINQGLLEESEYCRIQTVFHEAIHLFLRKFFAQNIDEFPELNEALADYLGFRLMMLYFKEKEPKKVLQASDYIGYETACKYATEKIALAVESGNEVQVYIAGNELNNINALVRRYFPIPIDENKETYNPYNQSAMKMHRKYTQLFFAVQDFFQKNGITPIKFLGNPQFYKKDLMEIARQAK